MQHVEENYGSNYIFISTSITYNIQGVLACNV